MALLNGFPRTVYDEVIVKITDYVYHYGITSGRAWGDSRVALLDAIGYAIETAASIADCKDLFGPVGPGTTVPHGFRLPGTCFRLDPFKGAFDLGTMIRSLDHNDALAGADWSYPSDNLGAIIAWRSDSPWTSIDYEHSWTLLHALIKAYKIQGCFLLRNAFNNVGLDHTILVSTAVVSWIMGLPEQQCMAALSHAWMDASPLRVYRSGANMEPRKRWAAGDACMRAVPICTSCEARTSGGPTVLTQPRWRFYDTTWRGGEPFVFPLPYRSWAIENVLFIVMSVEGHGISAVEASLAQRRSLLARDPTMDPDDHMGTIPKIEIRTCAAAKLTVGEIGALRGAAGGVRCMQYVVAVAFLKGAIPEHVDYADSSPYASSSAVDQLRAKTENYANNKMTDITWILPNTVLPQG